MNSWKVSDERVYRKYRPYPVSSGSEGKSYDDDGTPAGNLSQGHEPDPNGSRHDEDPFGEPFFDDFPQGGDFNRTPNSSGPLHLLNSLFSERLSLLQNAMDEIDSATKEREQLTAKALTELYEEIDKCELRLYTLEQGHNDFEKRRHLERRLFELKREKRRECLLSWRDLVLLRKETRKLRHEIDVLARTGNQSKERYGESHE
jgi:hypothetical protein